jgi:hypothetical protein
MTLFTSLDTLDVPYVSPLLGAFLLEGWKPVFRTILALLEAVAGDLIHGEECAECRLKTHDGVLFWLLCR